MLSTTRAYSPRDEQNDRTDKSKNGPADDYPPTSPADSGSRGRCRNCASRSCSVKASIISHLSISASSFLSSPALKRAFAARSMAELSPANFA